MSASSEFQMELQDNIGALESKRQKCFFRSVTFPYVVLSAKNEFYAEKYPRGSGGHCIYILSLDSSLGG